MNSRLQQNAQFSHMSCIWLSAKLSAVPDSGLGAAGCAAHSDHPKGLQSFQHSGRIPQRPSSTRLHPDGSGSKAMITITDILSDAPTQDTVTGSQVIYRSTTPTSPYCNTLVAQS